MSFNIDKDFSLTEEGTWVEYEGSQFLVAHITNLRFQRLLARLQQPHRKKIENATLDPAIAKDIMCEAMSQEVLRNWKQVTNGEGADVPYTPEVAKKVLLNNLEFREFIAGVASDVDRFRKEEVKEQGKS